jgi:hypothetical protein
MKWWLPAGIGLAIIVFIVGAFILLMFYYRPTFEWAR